jgi:hypothetical protein
MVSLLDLERPGLIIERMARKDVNSEAAVLRVAYARYDIIVLPLTLPNFNSIRIAETLHRDNISTRLLLHSATEALPEEVMPLFDYFVRKPAELSQLLATLDAACNERHPCRITKEQRRSKLMSGLLCKSIWSGHGATLRHGRSASLAEYRLGELSAAEHLRSVRIRRFGDALLSIAMIGAFASGLLIASYGLVHPESGGQIDLNFFAQHLRAKSAPVAAIFVGAAVIVLLVRRVLKSHDRREK